MQYAQNIECNTFYILHITIQKNVDLECDTCYNIDSEKFLQIPIKRGSAHELF